MHLSEVATGPEGEGRIDLAGIEGRTIELHLDGEARVLEIEIAGSAATLTDESGEEVGSVAEAFEGGEWFRPRAVSDAIVELDPGDADGAVILVRGAPPPSEIRRERSLVWTDATLLDDPGAVGLGRVLAASADDGHGGAMLDQWFRRFATTLHSERAAPAQLMDELAQTFGADPASWDLDALPFKVTGVHNRLDLAARGGACGELRVSLASTHPVYAPLHMLFLFQQVPQDDDVAPSGEVHCLGAARRWARLTDLDGEAFTAAASALLDEALVLDHFLLAETVELTVSPWEWRQWSKQDDGALDNPALFQTVATPSLNQPGALRDEFLAFVEDNASALYARELAIPQGFRAQSARVPPSVPAERLDLSGVDSALLSEMPDLAARIEIVGCPTCHTDDAEFVQTKVDRTFSPFYDKELDARGERLAQQAAGAIVPLPPFGPLQPWPLP